MKSPAGLGLDMPNGPYLSLLLIIMTIQWRSKLVNWYAMV